MNRYHRIIAIALVLLLTAGILSCASAANIVFGGAGQVNPQKTSIIGSGRVMSGYGSLSRNYYGYSLGGGVRGKWLSDTNAFSGIVTIQLFRQSFPTVPLTEHSSPANFNALPAETSVPGGSEYVPGYSDDYLNILTSERYAYSAVSYNIPNTIQIHYLCFLYELD